MNKIFIICLIAVFTLDASASQYIYNKVERKIMVAPSADPRMVAYKNLRRFCKSQGSIESSKKKDIINIRRAGKQKGLPAWEYQGYCIYNYY